MTPPALSICVPYYAGRRVLSDCLESLRDHALAAESAEVLVVENGSEDPCGNLIESSFPSVRHVALTRNLGFAAAVNRGIELAAAPWVLVLNPDTLVHAGALEALLTRARGAPDTAIVGPMLLNADGTFQAQCRRGRLTPLAGLSYALGIDRLAAGHPALDGYLYRGRAPAAGGDVEAVSGSCMLIRRAAWERLGGFNEAMFLYGEDLDFCYRTTAAGWRVLYEPGAIVTHLGGESGTRHRYLRSLVDYYRSLVLLLRAHPPNGFYRFYEWLVWLGLVAHAAVRLLSGVTGGRRVGSRKRAGTRLDEVAAP